MAGGAYVYRVAVFWINQDSCNALRILQPNICPVLAAIGRLVNTVADGNAVPRPAFACPDPDIFVVGRIDRYRSNRLCRFPVKYRLERGGAVDGLPYASACRSHDHGDL